MMFGCLKGFTYFWGEIENTKPIGSLPMGFVYVQSASLLTLDVGSETTKIFICAKI